MTQLLEAVGYLFSPDNDYKSNRVLQLVYQHLLQGTMVSQIAVLQIAILAIIALAGIAVGGKRQDCPKPVKLVQVCGSNKKTYPDICEFRCARKRDKTLKPLYKGRCREEGVLDYLFGPHYKSRD
ncbi:hypothetical protein GE061_002411 [Apolygus lucorum]|uniref:Uncharacterized protein n=1 Tax=Apolygus lucorum TaxID=248454 RepID=A0A6A4JKZ3_APOLU|nr:hypothetical protein GE061_002411 [Apolygus lucorum]